MASSYAKAQLQKVHADLKIADFQTLERITSFTRVALEVVDTDGITSDRSDTDSLLNRLIRFSKRHANMHSRKHDQDQEVLHRIHEAIFKPV